MGRAVLIVDDHELFSATLLIALTEYGFDVHRVVPDSYATVLDRASDLLPGTVVLDLDLGESADGRRLRGADIVAALRAIGWQVLVVSGSGPDRPDPAAAIAAGAIGVVPKLSSLETLVDTVARVAAGEPVMTEAEHRAWLAADREHRAGERELAAKLGRLTPREVEVLELLAEGRRAAEIAERFVVSITTVRTQIRSILRKLDVSSQLEAVAVLSRTTR